MMGIGAMGFIGGLPGVILLICQWIGVISLARRARDSAWWMMAGGTAGSTLGLLAGVVSFVFAIGLLSISSGRSPFDAASFAVVIASAGLSGLGTLSFGAGFVVHCLKLRRAHDRAGELEAVMAAMEEELRRLRGAPAVGSVL